MITITSFETVSLDILPCPQDERCVHWDAVLAIKDHLKNLTFDEMADIGEYLSKKGMIFKGEKCLKHHVRSEGVDYIDFSNVKINVILYKYGFIEP